MEACLPADCSVDIDFTGQEQMKTKKRTPSLVEFYDANSIIPVHQGGSLGEQQRARRILYHQLGLTNVAFSGSRVLEIGPGTGQNAIHLSETGISELVLLEPSREGYRCCELLREQSRFGCEVTVINLPVEKLEVGEYGQFDIVICEGLIGSSGYEDPKELIDRISCLVRSGGSLILSAEDEVGYLSEFLRRMWAHIVLGENGRAATLNSQIEALHPYFEGHLEAFSGSYKRKAQDWIADVILSPALDRPLVSLETLLGILERQFWLISTAPRMCAELTYYKVAAAESTEFENSSAIKAYRENIHNFLDYRIEPIALSSELRDKVERYCRNIVELVRQPEEDLTYWTDKVISLLERLEQLLPQHFSQLKVSLREWVAILEAESVTVEEFSRKRYLAGWYGRCQTYIHFTKKTKGAIDGKSDG